MTKKFIMCILACWLWVNFINCEYHKRYLILYDGKKVKQLSIFRNSKDIRIGVSGEYSFIADIEIYSAIQIKIKNNSEHPVIFNSKSIEILSKNFEYTLAGESYDLMVMPGYEKVFLLEYSANLPKEIREKEQLSIPLGEVLIMRIDSAILINNKPIRVNDIQFYP